MAYDTSDIDCVFFVAKLKATKPHMTHITSCRNVINFENTASAVFVVLG